MPGPARVAAEHVVQQVAELVEEGLHRVVLHQRRLAARRAAGSCTSARPRAARWPRDAVGQRELRVVLVLALARMHVEVDAAEQLLALDDVVGLDVGVPHRRVGDRLR